MPRSRRARRWVVLIGAVIAAVAVGGGAWAVTRDDGSAEASTMTAQASVGTFSETVTSTGTFQPARTSELSFAVSGEVTSVAVEVGDVVVADQALAAVDATTLEAELEAAEANLDAAQEQLDSDTDSDASDTQLAADEASVTAAESRVALAEEALANATLTSTIAGTVAAVDIAVGDEVSGGGSSGSSGSTGSTGSMASVPGAQDTSGSADTSSGAQITVISTDAFVVETSVSSADLARVTEGLQAEMTPSDTTDTVYGTVSTVGLVASSSSSGSGSATFPVQIEVTGEVAGLYAGGSTDVSIIVSQRTDVLTVPTAAVTTSDDAETTVTVVGEDGEEMVTTVEIGASFGVQTEILSGIAEGDEVVVSTTVPGRGGAGDGEGGFPGGGNLPEGFEIPEGFEFPSGGGFPGGGGFSGGQGR